MARALEELGVVAVLRGSDPGRVADAARALGAGGVTAVEVTYTVPGATDVIARLASEGGLVVGAGTVTTRRQADEAIAAGARFLVSPSICEAAVEAGAEADVCAIPGVYTPTELASVAARCPLLKLFPSAIGGPALLRALREPFPEVRLMPSGGVSLENLAQWIEAGAVAVSAGSGLCPMDAAAAGDWTRGTELATRWGAALREARAGMS
jgi:2-dehydro-3-deoxyphosphogluconate aldolase/(4S)-4-hydroxy-2-oxoglutarate aldolase